MNDFFQKLANGELPFTVCVSSKGGTPTSIRVGKVFFRDGNGKETIVMPDMVTLKTNDILGDKMPSSAALVAPLYGDKKYKITTTGNASIAGKDQHYRICPLPANWSQPRGNNETFATIRIMRQNGHDYLDIIFGDKRYGNDHAHIGFFSDGAGKFIRLRSHNCTLEGNSSYDAVSNLITPSELKIRINDFSEVLILKFDFDPINESVKLLSAIFLQD